MNIYNILLQEINVNDFIDIAVIGLIVYRFLLILQGTRASQILLGVAILATLFGISIYYELSTLSWLFTRFFQYFFLLFIILFQDEFRNILAGLGDTKFIGVKQRFKIDLQTEEVIHALYRLKKMKLGAIIVFEKNIGLRNFVKTGTSIDAKIHSDILFSLFQKESPLHDGACILFQNRIQAAGCFLPLSRNIDIDKRLGTRHRAALGLSEQTDAIAILLSEETGNVSLCVSGTLYEMESEDDLRRYLNKFMQNNKVSSEDLERMKA